MTERLQLRLQNRVEDIPAVNAAASGWLSERQAPAAVDYLANLAIEELVTNCIKYGYDDAAVHEIEIVLEHSGTELALIVTDDGHPFNPLDLPAPDTTAPVEERTVGGLGIHLLRRMSDSIDYQRIDGKNRLTVRKKL